MLDQRLHGWVVTIEFAQLDRQAFAQISSANPGRIELMQYRNNRLDLLLRGAEPLGGLPQIRRQVTCLIHEVDEVLPDHAPRRVSESNSQLFGKMAAERHFSGYECFEVVAVIIGGPAAPFGVG